MRRLTLLAMMLAAACASEESMFERAPRNRPVKVVVIEIEGSRASLVATEITLVDVRRVPGVIEVERGSGRNEVNCLVEARVDGEDLMSALSERYRVKVLRTVLRKDLPEEEK